MSTAWIIFKVAAFIFVSYFVGLLCWNLFYLIWKAPELVRSLDEMNENLKRLKNEMR